MDTDNLLPIKDFAEQSGVHVNTLRKLIRESRVTYYCQDLESDEVIGPIETPAQRPKRFKYLLPERSLHDVISQVHDSVSTAEQAEPTTHTVATQVTPCDVTELREKLVEAEKRADRAEALLEREKAAVDQLEAQNEHLWNHVQRLLPPANTVQEIPHTGTSQVTHPTKQTFWQRLFRGRSE